MPTHYITSINVPASSLDRFEAIAKHASYITNPNGPIKDRHEAIFEADHLEPVVDGMSDGLQRTSEAFYELRNIMDAMTESSASLCVYFHEDPE